MRGTCMWGGWGGYVSHTSEFPLEYGLPDQASHLIQLLSGVESTLTSHLAIQALTMVRSYPKKQRIHQSNHPT